MKVQIDELKQQMDAIVTEFPELADDEDLRADMFEGETDINWVMGRLVDYDADARGMASAIADRVKDLNERKARYSRRSEVFRQLALGVLQRADLKKVELPTATVSLRNVPPAVMISDHEALPQDCLRIKTEPDKAAIKAALATGHVPGAYLTNGSVSVSIRTK